MHWLIWEAPQNLLGLVVLLALRAAGRVVAAERARGRLFVQTRGVGVSLGWFVFWSREFGPGFADGARNREHEYGHSIQSRWFGPLYLLLVGVPSVSRVIYGLIYYRRTGRRWRHYYDGWPEDHADRLGGVVRG